MNSFITIISNLGFLVEALDKWQVWTLFAVLSSFVVISPALVFTVKNRLNATNYKIRMGIVSIINLIGLLLFFFLEWDAPRALGVLLMALGCILGWILLGFVFSSTYQNQNKSNLPSIHFNRLIFFLTWLVSSVVCPLMLIFYASSLLDNIEVPYIRHLSAMTWIICISWIIVMSSTLLIVMKFPPDPDNLALVMPILRSLSACLLLWSILAVGILLGLAMIGDLMKPRPIFGSKMDMKGKFYETKSYDRNEGAFVFIVIAFGPPLFFLPFIWALKSSVGE